MKILSFDVGIKNLAYCIINYVENKLSIDDWNIINLIDNKENQLNCISADCTNKIKSYIEFNNIKYYFCTRHFKEKEKFTEPIIVHYKEENWKQAENINKEHEYICSNCGEERTGHKTFYKNNTLNQVLCNKHYKMLINKVNNLCNKGDLLRKKKVKDMTVNDLKLALINNLDSKKELFLKGINMVLIENQPTFKNPTMKAISDTIYAWFIIRGIIDKNINNSTVTNIKFISPSNKLKQFGQEEIKNADGNKKYKITKKLSIENTNKILTHYEMNNWIDKLNKFDKKDDLCDSFLQGWNYLYITDTKIKQEIDLKKILH